MSEDENPKGPSEESVAEIPEQESVRPDGDADLRRASQHAVFVDREIWEHFGGEERILEVLRLLVDIAKKRSG